MGEQERQQRAEERTTTLRGVSVMKRISLIAAMMYSPEPLLHARNLAPGSSLTPHSPPMPSSRLSRDKTSSPTRSSWQITPSPPTTSFINCRWLRKACINHICRLRRTGRPQPSRQHLRQFTTVDELCQHRSWGAVRLSAGEHPQVHGSCHNTVPSAPAANSRSRPRARPAI